MNGRYLYVNHVRDVMCRTCGVSTVSERDGWKVGRGPRISHVLKPDGKPFFVRGDNPVPVNMVSIANCPNGHKVEFRVPDDVAPFTEAEPIGATTPVFYGGPLP